MNERDRSRNESSLPIQPDRNFAKEYEGLSKEAAIALTPGVEAEFDPVQIVIERYKAWQESQKDASLSTPSLPIKRRTREKIIADIVAQFGGADYHTILDTLYTVCELSVGQISKATGTSIQFIYNQLLLLGIPPRTRSQAGVIRFREDEKMGRPFSRRSPESEKRRIEGVRRAFQERKDKIVDKIHASGSDKKRSESLKRRFATDPGYRESNIRFARKAARANHNKAVEHQHSLFGGNRRQGLVLMHYGEGLSIAEIAQKTGYSEERIYNFFHEEGIRATTPDSGWFDKFKKFSTLLPSLWEDPSLFRTLNPNEQYIIRRRFLSEGPTPTLEEVGKELGLTRQRIKQLEDRAIYKLGQVTSEL